MGLWETNALALAERPLGYHPCDIGILTCGSESSRGTLLGGQFDWGGRLLKSNGGVNFISLYYPGHTIYRFHPYSYLGGFRAFDRCLLRSSRFRRIPDTTVELRYVDDYSRSHSDYCRRKYYHLSGAFQEIISQTPDQKKKMIFNNTNSDRKSQTRLP